MSVTFGSLFAGIGGFDLGFERAGMTCKWQVENDPFCIRVLERHWPHVARFRDIREWTPDRDQHAVDVLCGGFPCQDLSVAGQRAGLAGARSGLFWQLVRVASILRPGVVVLENVPGLLSSHGGRDMGAIIGALADIGYSVAWRVLDARYFGVAQRRRRVFIVGHPDPGCAAAILFESEGGAGNSQAVRAAGTDVAYALDAGTGGVSGKENQRTLVHSLSSEGADASEDGTGRGTPLVAACLQSRIGKGGFTDPVNDNIVAFNWQSGGSAPRLGIGTTTTALAGTQCPAIDSDRMRATPGVPGPLDLCAVCQKGPDAPRYRAIGNAVVSNVAEWIGRRIVALRQGELYGADE